MQRHQIDLWYVLLDNAAEPLLEAEYRSLLSLDEIKRHDRLIPQEARRQSLVGRALLRTTLTHYTDIDPRRWEFQFSPHGKPSIRYPSGLPWEFNLSHTRGLAVCAVSRSHAVGVDAEHYDHKLEFLSLARRFFHKDETAVLEGLPPSHRREAFFQTWTLKEAYLKARGTGLSTPLDSFAFSVETGRPPQISEAAMIKQPGGDWAFAQWQLSGRYEIALAARLPAGQRLQLRIRETLPLRWQRPWQQLLDQAANRWIIA